jgi:hypothetical protein
MISKSLKLNFFIKLETWFSIILNLFKIIFWGEYLLARQFFSVKKTRVMWFFCTNCWKKRKNQGPLKKQRHSTLNARKEQKDEKLQY